MANELANRLANRLANICSACGANLDLVGRVHRCVVAASTARPKKPTTEQAFGAYRHRDAERRRAYMRDYMRRRRSEVS